MSPTPLAMFQRFVQRVESAITLIGATVNTRGFKTGGTTNQVPIKSSSTNFAWSWGYLSWSMVIGKPTTFTPSTHTHPQSQVVDLVADLASKASGADVALRALITNTALVVPTYADNAAAVTGGLAVNRVYKTVTGELRIVV